MIINKFLTYVVFIVFISISTFAVYSDITNVTNRFTTVKHVQQKLQGILELRVIIKELQKERGLNNIYYSNKNKETQKALLTQRKKLSQLIQNKKLKNTIRNLHYNIDNTYLKKEEAFSAYTKEILFLLMETRKLLLFADDQDIKNHLLIYQKTNFVQEYLGELRAKIGSLIAKKEINDDEYIEIIKLQSLVQNFIDQTKEIIFLTKVSIESPIDKKCFVKTNYIINAVVHKNLKSITASPLEWFDTSTCAIDAIGSTMTTYLLHIESEVQKKLSFLETKLIYHTIFWGFAIIMSLFLSYILFNTNKKMRDKQRLLEDYKKAIDKSTIVSKTDKYGIITYVNNAFCKISGYKQTELLGKPHNIVRHPNTSKDAFKELWNTIKGGDAWSGTLANLKKDQSTYWVNATVSPIYDDNENLIEYIAIRHDITQMISLNDEIKNTQYELIYRMGESVESRSKESGNHIQRVAHYSKLLAYLYGMDNQEADTIFIASTMHDMGKIAIPDSILLKTAKLTNAEWEIMKNHSAIGYNILAGSHLPILKMAADIAYEHHEHYDGKGYPRGIKGNEISIYARIVSISDVFDALISKRVYKEAWSLEKTLKLFEEESGKQFDHELTQLFLANIDEFMLIKEKFED